MNEVSSNLSDSSWPQICLIRVGQFDSMLHRDVVIQSEMLCMCHSVCHLIILQVTMTGSPCTPLPILCSLKLQFWGCRRKAGIGARFWCESSVLPGCFDALPQICCHRWQCGSLERLGQEPGSQLQVLLKALLLGFLDVIRILLVLKSRMSHDCVNVLTSGV